MTNYFSHRDDGGFYASVSRVSFDVSTLLKQFAEQTLDVQLQLLSEKNPDSSAMLSVSTSLLLLLSAFSCDSSKAISESRAL